MFRLKKKLPWLIIGTVVVIVAGFFIQNYSLNPAKASVLEAIQTGMGDCYQLTDKTLDQERCFKSLALSLVGSYEFPDIIQSFGELNTNRSCHNVMHYVVNEEYRRGMDLPAVYEQCTSVCFNACYHGGLEGYFIDHNLQGASIEKINQEVRTVCNSVNDMRGQCYHGLGHALMLITNGELLQSLKFCDVLEENAFHCYGGVFMENVPNTATITENDHPIKYIKADDPLYPCDILEKKYESYCYEYQVAYFYYLAQDDWKKVGEYCALVPKEYYGLCFERIGSGTLTQDLDFGLPNQICSKQPPGQAQEYCIRGVIDSFLDRFAGNNEKLLRMVDFCPTVSNSYQLACYDQVGKTMNKAHISTQVRKITCDIENPKFKQICLSAE